MFMKITIPIPLECVCGVLGSNYSLYLELARPVSTNRSLGS